MPYFVYFVTVNPANNTKKLEYVDKLDSYKEARELARTKRAEIGGANVNHFPNVPRCRAATAGRFSDIEHNALTAWISASVAECHFLR